MQKQAQQPLKGKEEKGPLVQIKLGAGKSNEGTGGVGVGVKKGGFKKGGFKSAFGSGEDEEQVEVKKDEDFSMGEMRPKPAQDEDSDLTDEEDYYDPRQPTDCMPGCTSRVRAAVV
jgi:hypothetical protein